MSGTSIDGVDAALLWTDGGAIIEPRGFHFEPYADDLRARCQEAMAAVRGAPARVWTPELRALEADLTDLNALAVERLIVATGQRPELVGYHGQTIVHRPDLGWTWQLGDGPALARRLGITAVWDLRRADMEAGGQGAPLLPVFHRALVSAFRAGSEPIGILNLGGVGNLTWLGPDLGTWLSFDTGPANALVDDLMRRTGGEGFDRGGALAASGRVDESALARLLDHPYFAAPPPKSLDRDAFSAAPVAGLFPANAAATLTAFTAEAVARALAHVPVRPARLLVTGGGRHNLTMMREIAQRTGVLTAPVESVGWDGDALEAQAFAYFAVRRVTGRPITFPETTGCREPTVGGAIATL